MTNELRRPDLEAVVAWVARHAGSFFDGIVAGAANQTSFGGCGRELGDRKSERIVAGTQISKEVINLRFEEVEFVVAVTHLDGCLGGAEANVGRTVALLAKLDEVVSVARLDVDVVESSQEVDLISLGGAVASDDVGLPFTFSDFPSLCISKAFRPRVLTFKLLIDWPPLMTTFSFWPSPC